MNKNINIDEENDNHDNLSEIAPTLAAIPKVNPYEVPMNYFDNLEEFISKNVLATSLEAIPKENPFEVPTGYFERLDSEIIDNVLASQKKKGFEWKGIFSTPKYAVSFVTMVLAVFFVFKVSTVNRMDKYSFTEQEIANSGEINDIDEGTIIETLYSDNKTNALPKQKDIENYLLDNDVDESQITGQL